MSNAKADVHCMRWHSLSSKVENTWFFSAVAIKGYLIIAVGNLSFSDFGTYNPAVPVYFLNYDLLVFKP